MDQNKPIKSSVLCILHSQCICVARLIYANCESFLHIRRCLSLNKVSCRAYEVRSLFVCFLWRNIVTLLMLYSNLSFRLVNITNVNIYLFSQRAGKIVKLCDIFSKKSSCKMSPNIIIAA